MPNSFSKNLSAVFEPDDVKVLAQAFDEAWASVQAKVAHDNNARDRARTVLAEQIITRAKTGERDKAVLREQALQYLAAQGLL